MAQAGQSGTVTIATNMAGRGTDIKLSDAVRKAGGLAIIGTSATNRAASTVSCAVSPDDKATRVHRYSTYRSKTTSCE